MKHVFSVIERYNFQNCGNRTITEIFRLQHYRYYDGLMKNLIRLANAINMGENVSLDISNALVDMVDISYIFNLIRAYHGQTFDYKVCDLRMTYEGDDVEPENITQTAFYDCYIFTLFGVCIYTKNMTMLRNLWRDNRELLEPEIRSLIWAMVSLQDFDEKFIGWLIRTLNITSVDYKDMTNNPELMLMLAEREVNILFDVNEVVRDIRNGKDMDKLLYLPGYPIFDENVRNAHVEVSDDPGVESLIDEHIRTYLSQEDRDIQLGRELRKAFMVREMQKEMDNIRLTLNTFINPDEETDEETKVIVEDINVFETQFFRSLNMALEEAQMLLHQYENS